VEVASCHLCHSAFSDPSDQCVFINTQLKTSISICSKCIDLAIDDKVKNIWYNANPQEFRIHLSCPYCSVHIMEATYDCILIKQNIKYTIPMHAGCFEENIGIGL
jgi:hypothetical protein